MLLCVIKYEDIPPLLPALSSSVLSIVAIVVLVIVVVVIIALIVLFLLMYLWRTLLAFLLRRFGGGHWGVAVS